MNTWTKDVHHFWFEEATPKQYWNGGDEFDALIRSRFLAVWEEQKSKAAASFLTSGVDALAAVILFDQFPRNIHRGDALAFATDPLALEIAKGAIDAQFDDALPSSQRSFLYMPFMHSENLADQDKSVALFTALGSNEKFAQSHRDVIAKFGRFPHRNKILGRESSPEEIRAVAEGSSW